MSFPASKGLLHSWASGPLSQFASVVPGLLTLTPLLPIRSTRINRDRSPISGYSPWQNKLIATGSGALNKGIFGDIIQCMTEVFILRILICF